MDRVVNDELIFCSYLYIIAGFQLAVFHMVFLHAHESCIRVRFGKAVTVAECFMIQTVFGDTRHEVLADHLHRLFQCTAAVLQFFANRDFFGCFDFFRQGIHFLFELAGQ